MSKTASGYGSFNLARFDWQKLTTRLSRLCVEKFELQSHVEALVIVWNEFKKANCKVWAVPVSGDLKSGIPADVLMP
jgi:hypothetical protein